MNKLLPASMALFCTVSLLSSCAPRSQDFAAQYDISGTITNASRTPNANALIELYDAQTGQPVRYTAVRVIRSFDQIYYGLTLSQETRQRDGVFLVTACIDEDADGICNASEPRNTAPYTVIYRSALGAFERGTSTSASPTRNEGITDINIRIQNVVLQDQKNPEHRAK